MGKSSKQTSVSAKSMINRMKKIHLRQHLRRVIKKCLKKEDCGMDIAAFESWKRLGFGGINELGDFAKEVEIKNGRSEIIDVYSTAEIESVLTRERKRGPSYEEQMQRAKEKAAALKIEENAKKQKKNRRKKGKKPDSADKKEI